MDANQTRFHLLLGDDWKGCTAEPGATGRAEYDEARHDFTLHSRVFDFPARRGDRAPTLADRRGAARDRFGNWYWIDTDGSTILVNSEGSGTTTVFWRRGLGEPERIVRPGEFADAPNTTTTPEPLMLGGLAVTENHYLVAGVADPGGLIVFDLRVTGPPRQTVWPENVHFRPFDLAARSGGGAWVLDRCNHRLWELDRSFLVVSRRSGIPAAPGMFVPADGSDRIPAAPAPQFGEIAPDDALLLPGDPVAVDAAPDGSVLVLDRVSGAAPSTVRRIEHGVETDSFQVMADVVPVLAHDIAFVPAPEPRGQKLGELYAVDSAGNQSYRFDLSLDEHGALKAVLVREYYPMRVFGGKALVATPDGPFYDFADRFIPLVNQCRPSFDEAGTVLTPVLDGHAPATVWHRLLIDGSIPPDSDVRISSRAADDRRELAVAAWNLEPRLHLRGDGSELPFVVRPAGDLEGTWELLFQRAKGQFLQLRLELSGDGRTSPRLRALRAYYPRFSYLHEYLPKVYRENPASASFLDRFLANLEGFDTAIEDRIAASQILFDARSAPAETLDWLARWFDFALDPGWPEARRRLFIRHAMDFFRVRGTVRGLELTLRLALDSPTCADERLFDEPATQGSRAARIVERFRTRLSPAVVVGDPTEVTGPQVVATANRWSPEQGRDGLRDRWRAYLGKADDESIELPPLVPKEDLDRWKAFGLETLGFDPAAGQDLGAWRDFLARRYSGIAAFDTAYGLTGSARHAAFANVDFPTEVPADGAALRDWFQFQAIVLAMRRDASRFTVLLPVPTASADPTELTQADRRELAQRVVDLHKPAHTTFDIKFFWSAFRVGQARLGEDTLIDLGSRSPLLLQQAVLGRQHLGETTLGGDPPPILTDPPSLGRNPVGR